MNATPTQYAAPQLRASDADRDAVLAQLSEHFQAGRLTSDELAERTGQALAARTYGELDALTADLPGLVQQSSGPAAPPALPVPGGHRGALAVLAVLAAVLLASAAYGVGTSWHHAADLWWIFPVALLAARRLARPASGLRARGPGARGPRTRAPGTGGLSDRSRF